MPLCFFSGAVIMKTNIKSATGPLVTQDLRPLTWVEIAIPCSTASHRACIGTRHRLGQ